jgi:hypothetical protein
MSDSQSDDDKERRLAEDSTEFGLDNAVGTGDAVAEVTTTSGNKLVLIGLIAGVISVLLVACITALIIGYQMTKRKADPAADQAKIQQFERAEEAKAKIKRIDRDAKSIRFLMFNDARKTYQITDRTEFFDPENNVLPMGLDDAALREEQYCVILPTDDQISLRWLKLTDAPK